MQSSFQQYVKSSALVICLLTSTGAAYAATDSYDIDPGHTHISFTVERFGFAKTLGIFPDSSGTLVIDQEHPENSSVSAKVQTASVWSGLAARDDAIHSKFWLNTKNFTEISFQSTKVELTGETSANVSGNLTLWGETHPVVFAATLNKIGPDRTAKGKGAIGMSISGQILRSDFGNKTAIPMVGDQVNIQIEMVAHLK